MQNRSLGVVPALPTVHHAARENALWQSKATLSAHHQVGNSWSFVQVVDDRVYAMHLRCQLLTMIAVGQASPAPRVWYIMPASSPAAPFQHKHGEK